MRLTIIVMAAVTAGIVLPASRPAPPSSPPAVLATPHPELEPPPPDRSVIGSLDKVDVSTMQIVVATTAGKVAFRVQNGATIRQGSRKLAPADLARHTGERVKVRYQESGGQRQTDWIMLATPPRRASKTSV